ncbi:MAG: hypothetical protein ABIA91_01355, partial [Patescibacteria group bacterium]
IDGVLYVTGASTLTGAITLTGASTFTGLATFDKATATSATTTDYLYIGPDGAEGTFDFQGGDLYVANDAEVDGVLIVAGLGTFVSGIDTAGATTDITLQNDETIMNATDGSITFGTTAMSMATTTATTTGSVWVSAPAAVATSTVIVGGGEAGDASVNSGCLELWRENIPYRAYIDKDGTGLKVEAGRCKD